MKPRFALSLSSERIVLLHRVSRGWNRAGEVSLDSAELAAELRMLRTTASALESGGVRCKLVLPEDQILYTRIPLDVTSSAPHEPALRAALVGLTPYDVDDLVFDWEDKGDHALVAVVARETLQEAEAFASDHKFNPVSFVAIPKDADAFPREPWFGTTRLAATLQAGDDEIERDTDIIQVVGRSAPTPEAEKPVSEIAFTSQRSDPAEAQPAPSQVTADTIAPAKRLNLEAVMDSLGEKPRLQDVSITQSDLAIAPNAPPPPAPPVPVAKPTPAGVQELAVHSRPSTQAVPPVRARTVLLAAALAIIIVAIALWAFVFGNTPTQHSSAADTEAVQSAETQDAQPPEISPDAPQIAMLSAPVAPQAPTAAVSEAPPTQIAPVSLSAAQDLPAPVTAPQQVPRAQPPVAGTEIWTQRPPVTAHPGAVEDVYITSVDPEVSLRDALALPAFPDVLSETAPSKQPLPSKPAEAFVLDARGLVTPTPAGTRNPDGVLVVAGRPNITALVRPDGLIAPVALEPEVNIFAGIRPRVRPANLSELNERATLGGFSRAELAQVRPKARPASAQERFAAQNPLELAEPDPVVGRFAVARSAKPNARPSNFARLVDKALQEARATPAPAVPAAAVVTPRIPSSSSVAKRATLNNAINLAKVNLIGVYGSKSNRRALVRLPSGKYRKVQVGDRVDGGKVAAIGESELRYVKGGRNIVLSMPKS